MLYRNAEFRVEAFNLFNTFNWGVPGAGTEPGRTNANLSSGSFGRITSMAGTPRIMQIGVEKNPDQPYGDPRVTRHVNDGRAFLETTDTKYDLILFALPASLALVTGASQIRLESFLFTQQALTATPTIRHAPSASVPVVHAADGYALAQRLGPG